MELNVFTDRGNAIRVNTERKFFLDDSGSLVNFSTIFWTQTPGGTQLAIDSDIGQIGIADDYSSPLDVAYTSDHKPDGNQPILGLEALQNALNRKQRSVDATQRDLAQKEAVALAIEYPIAFLCLKAHSYRKSRIAGKAAAGETALRMIECGKSPSEVKPVLLAWERHLPTGIQRKPASSRSNGQ